MTTEIADVIVPEFFDAAVTQRLVSQSLVFRSGLIEASPRYNVFAQGPSTVGTLPFWNRIGGNSNVSTDDPAITSIPGQITQGREIYSKFFRNNSWASADLVASVIDEDPIQVIETQVAEYWIQEYQRLLLLMLRGVFAAASMSANRLNLASEDPAGVGTPVTMGPDIVSQAKALMGDRVGDLVAIAMHTDIIATLESEQAITYVQDPTGNVNVPRYMGLNVIPTMDAPVRAGTTSGLVYTSYIFANGAVAYGEGRAKVPVEFDRAPAAGRGAGVETLYSRREWIFHPRGVSWEGAAADFTPSDAELIVGANWLRQYEPENVPIIAITTNG